jgi:MFS family permease
LLPPYAVFAIAFGAIIVPRLNLVLSLICREYLQDKALNDPNFTFAPVLLAEDNPQCQIPEIQALSTKFMLYVGLISGILAAITSPKIGSLSDRYGRKPMLVFTSMGALLSEITFILCAKFPDQIHYSWVLLGSVLDGLCGSFIANFAISHSYVADVTHPSKRAVAFGYLHAFLFVGIALGPLLAAQITAVTGTIMTVFYAAFTLHAIVMSFILFAVPESVTPKRQQAAREKHALDSTPTSSGIISRIQSANLLSSLKILYPTGEGSTPQLRTNLLLLAAVDTILFGTAMASMTVVLLYSEFRFHWGNTETNLFMSLVNTARVIALLLILPLLSYLFRTRRRNRALREYGIVVGERNSGSDNLDLWTIRASVLFEIVGYGGYMLSPTGPVFAMSGVFAAFGGIGSPTLQSALTKHVPHERTGQLLGAMGLLHALARIVWPTGISLIYANTVHKWPNFVFGVLASCFVAAFLCSLFIRPHVYLDEPGDATPARERDADTVVDDINDEEAGGM